MKLLLLATALASAVAAQQPFQVKVTGHGQPMILIPGLYSSGETWDTTVAHYKDHYECHVLTVAGFAGVPRVPAPMLDAVRDGLGSYIREHKLASPVIVGHSLGGFVALTLAAKYPDLPGRLVIVDAYPFLAGVMDPKATPQSARENAAQMRQYMSAQTEDDYQRYLKSGLGSRAMVTKDSDFDRLLAWELASDRTAATDAMVEMTVADLRQDVVAIKSRTLVLGAWIGYKQYGATHDSTLENLKAQYAKLSGVEFRVTDTARHFIMWDDGPWMWENMDRFLAQAGETR
jgi:pimeloyl-ACP methyl ester carboxylesterase